MPARGFRSLRTRDPVAAARSAVLILLTSAVAVAAWTVLETDTVSGAATSVCWATVVLLVGTAGAYRYAPAERLDRLNAGVLGGVACVVLVCLLRVLTADTSAGAHAFLTFPVLWAASYLRRGGVVLVTGAALVADAVAVLLLMPVRAALTDLFFFGGVLVLVAVVLHRAASTQARLVAALQQQAEVDALTGLVNRRVFEQALSGSAHDAGTALVLIDVDAFKSINDVHGHPAGDEVLVHLSSVLRDQVRADDAVLSRLGGDELAVLLHGCTAETAARRAESLLEAVQATPVMLPGGVRLPLSISVGVAHVPGRDDDLRSLYAAADAALYDAKRNGRGRVAVAAAPPPIPDPRRPPGVARRRPRVG